MEYLDTDMDPDYDEDDFMRKDNAMTALIRWGAIPTLIVLTAALALSAAVFS